jgi:hypothetical protein
MPLAKQTPDRSAYYAPVSIVRNQSSQVHDGQQPLSLPTLNGNFAPGAALGGLEIQLPLYPRNRTQLGNRGMSEMCDNVPRAINLLA